jgi:hypothetical protein
MMRVVNCEGKGRVSERHRRRKEREKTHLAVHEERLPAGDGAVKGDGGAEEE